MHRAVNLGDACVTRGGRPVAVAYATQEDMNAQATVAHEVVTNMAILLMVGHEQREQWWTSLKHGQQRGK